MLALFHTSFILCPITFCTRASTRTHTLLLSFSSMFCSLALSQLYSYGFGMSRMTRKSTEKCVEKLYCCITGLFSKRYFNFMKNEKQGRDATLVFVWRKMGWSKKHTYVRTFAIRIGIIYYLHEMSPNMRAPLAKSRNRPSMLCNNSTDIIREQLSDTPTRQWQSYSECLKEKNEPG